MPLPILLVPNLYCNGELPELATALRMIIKTQLQSLKSKSGLGSSSGVLKAGQYIADVNGAVKERSGSILGTALKSLHLFLKEFDPSGKRKITSSPG